MIKKRSIFNRLILNMLPLWMIPFFLVLALLFNYTCIKTKNEEIRLQEDKMASFMQIITTEKNIAITKSDYIVNNSFIRKCLEFDSDILVERYINNNQISEYISALGDGNKDSIVIYTDNPSIMVSRYTDSIDNLTNKDDIFTLLSQKNQFFFEDKLITDNDGNQYIRLYRRLVSKNETIIEIKAYLPKKEGFFVTKYNQKYAKDKSYLFSNITDKLIAVTKLNSKALTEIYLWYGFIFFMIGILFLAIILVASMAITNKTTRTINAYILKLSCDDFPANIENIHHQNSSWELEAIKSAIDKLMEENKLKTEAQYRIELEKRRLELELLQSKIDPHILYNSLATISLRAYMNKDDELALLISDLTDYYRSVLAQGRDFTTVGEEIELVRRFVRISEISHTQTFELQTDVDEDILSHRLLHLMLQPFVENSIVHGLAGKPEPKIIKITAKRDDKKLAFEIYDNGYGMTPEKLFELNNPKPSDTNYAIQNTGERLRVFYGDNAEIKFDSKLNEFTRVKISIMSES